MTDQYLLLDKITEDQNTIVSKNVNTYFDSLMYSILECLQPHMEYILDHKNENKDIEELEISRIQNVATKAVCIFTEQSKWTILEPTVKSALALHMAIVLDKWLMSKDLDNPQCSSIFYFYKRYNLSIERLWKMSIRKCAVESIAKLIAMVKISKLESVIDTDTTKE